MAFIGESLKTLNNFIRQAEAVFNERSSSNDTKTRPPDYPEVWDKYLTALTKQQSLAFEITFGILCVLSLCGNCSTLYVNSSRKMRPFFRTCLISLALSDLLSTIFLMLANFPKFLAEYVQIWLLGPCMCRFVPLVTTATILASSMTLVGIALDRYFAIRKAVVSSWNPGVTACCLYALAIWIVSFAIATPVLFVCHNIQVWIMTEVRYTSVEFLGTITWQAEVDYDDGVVQTLLERKDLVTMCVSDEQDVALYYAIVFGIIFLPCIVAFVWLNSIIARTIWIRRHRTGPMPQTEQSRKIAKSVRRNSNETMDASFKKSSEREARHIRMFIVIVVLMAVFIVLRLPAWIFLVIRLYRSHTNPNDWVINFSFGALNLASCALNPIFYTFLPETLQTLRTLKLCAKKKRTKIAENCEQTERCQGDVPCCICCGILCRFPCVQSCQCDGDRNADWAGEKTKQQGHLNADFDEGVDCNDVSYDDDDFELRKQEICIVYTPSMASTCNQRQKQVV